MVDSAERGSEPILGIPLNLRYVDPTPPRLEPDVVIDIGKRYMRRRIIRGYSIAASAMAVLATATCVASVPHGGQAVPANMLEVRQLQVAHDYPPLGPIAILGVVDHGVRIGWSEVAWISKNEHLCFGIINQAKQNDVQITCLSTPQELNPLDGAPAVYPPISTAELPEPESVLAFGFTRGAFSSIVISTTFGTSASVNSIKMIGDGRVGIYSVMVPTGGKQSFDLTTMTTVSGYDSNGRIVARSQATTG